MAAMKVTLRLFAGVTAVLLLLACGPRPAGTGSRVKVTFWHAMGGPLGDALKAMVDDFERLHQDVDVELVSMSDYGTLSQKLMAAVQVNAPPNLAQMYESWTTQFHKLGKLVVLDSIIHGPEGLTTAELADFFPAFIDDNTWDGRIVTMPFNKSLQVFFYNIDTLEAYGFREFPKTWPEFRSMASRLSNKAQGRYGTTGLVTEAVFGAMLRQKGGDYFDAGNRKVTFNSRAGVEAARFMRDMAAVDSSVAYGGGYEAQNDFIVGKTATMLSTSVSWAHVRAKIEFPVGMAPLPSWGRPNVLSQGTNVGVFRTGDAQQVAACWKFIKWFTEPEQQAKWAEMTFYVPVRRSSLAAPGYAALMARTPGMTEAWAQLEYMSFEPKIEAWFGGRKAVGEALEQIVRTGVDPQAALDGAAARIAPELAK